MVDPDIIQKCDYTNCMYTTDRQSMPKSDAILFHWRDISILDTPTRMYKPKTQKWILLNQESPLYTRMKYPTRIFNIRLFDFIDWTMSYRLDSDIYTPYGLVEKCQKQFKPNYYQLYKDKTKPIAWIVSHCNTSSKRELFVKHLKRYLDVDVYGSCGTLECLRDNPQECLKSIEKNYKFYLAFENSLCKDYVTEKLFDLLQYDIIPVVYGRANYSAILPPNSYIDALDFPTVLTLADHLIQVANNELVYNRYFEWKHTYCVKPVNYLCTLCKHLNENDGSKPSNTGLKDIDLIKWWVNDAQCQSIEIKNP